MIGCIWGNSLIPLFPLVTSVIRDSTQGLWNINDSHCVWILLSSGLYSLSPSLLPCRSLFNSLVKQSVCVCKWCHWCKRQIFWNTSLKTNIFAENGWLEVGRWMFPFKNSPFLDIFCYIFSVKKDVSLLHFEDRRGRDLRKPAGWGWWLSLPSAWAAGDMGWKTRKIWGEDAWIGQRSMIHEMSSSEIPIFFFLKF